MQKLLYIFSFLMLATVASAQIDADVKEGCVPLQVSFTGPTLSTYFWDFDDNSGNSDDASPSRIFDIPGTYEVELFEGQGGQSQGKVIIQVYADPEIAFTANKRNGCSPLNVAFINESIIDPNVIVTGYQWTFGDGASSTQQNPVHSYINQGDFDVTLKIFSSLPECNNEMTFEDYITVSGTLQSGFSLNTLEICELPATFTIVNNTPDDPSYTYNWDFGNGTFSDVRNPGTVTYTEKGSYNIVLTVDNGEGCTPTPNRTVKVGGPDINLGLRDTVCINDIFNIPNFTDAATFQWTFPDGVFPPNSTDRSPEVQFLTEGTKLISLSATSSTGCVTDTIFTVYVEEVDATFYGDPAITCEDPAMFTLIANDPNLATYSWSGTNGGNTFSFTYDDPDRDSFYINRPDSIYYTLLAVSNAGCIGVSENAVVYRGLEAHFIPDVSRGCAPLTVEFEQLSASAEQITRFDWDFGDGQTANDNQGDNMSHTFQNPGEYYVKLIVENEVGCIDTSTGVWIYVGEFIESDVTIDQTSICLFDNVNFTAENLDPRIDAWHFTTDEGRNGHCYESPITSHTFQTKPGIYPITLEIEYNGCISNTEVGQIEVEGAKALINYMMNCDDPYTVMLQDSSFGATRTEWTIEGQTFQTGELPDSILNYTFQETGIYTVVLEAWDDDSSCPSDRDSVEIHVRDIHASFEVPELFCEGEITLDASSSTDVDDRCYKGYTWYLPASRPRRVRNPILKQGFFQGPDPDREWDIRLEVEDINGCTDDTTITVRVYDIDADFEFSREKLCFPSELTLTDASVSDTTITSWTWSTTNQIDSVVTYTAEAQNDTLYTVDLYVEDALGCKDTIQRSVNIYEISSIPNIVPSTICIGDSLNISATDYTEDGSFLLFDWRIKEALTTAEIHQTTQQNFKYSFPNSGTYTVDLFIEEDASGCENSYPGLVINVVDIPVAAFTAPDGPLCAGTPVDYVNNSVIDGAGGYFWDFGNGAPISQVEDPAITYNEAGTFTIQLIAASAAGCADTTTLEVETILPSGDFTVSKTEICDVDDVTFTLSNTSNVDSWEWDFGDGNTAENESPITHEYEIIGSEDNLIRAKLILKALDSDCSNTIDIDINLTTSVGGFSLEKDENSCPGTILVFESDTIEYSSIQYFFEGEFVSNQTIDTLFAGGEGSFEVTQIVVNANGICTDTVIQNIVIDTAIDPAIPNLFSPNGDGANDFFDVVFVREDLEDDFDCTIVTKMQIFNRWGELVYDNDNPLTGWDGKINGSDAPSDVYLYIVEVSVNGTTLEPFKGNVLLKY